MSESTTPTQTTCYLSPDDPAKKDRETFSHQTLVLTALTAINSANQHPSLNDAKVRVERFLTMKDKAESTRVIDAATTILVTNAEVIATMAHGADSIVTLTEINRNGEHSLPRVRDLLQSRAPDTKQHHIFGEVDELIPADEIIRLRNEPRKSDHQVFVSFPNPRKSNSSFGSNGDRVCTSVGDKHWTKIWNSKKVLIGYNQ